MNDRNKAILWAQSMPEHIDDRVKTAIDYYLRVSKNYLVVQNQLQQLAITQFNLNNQQIAEFRLKIYQLNMQEI